MAGSDEEWTTERAMADPVPIVRSIKPFQPQVAEEWVIDNLRLRLNPAIARLASADRTLPWEVLPSDLTGRQQAPDPTLLRDQLAYWASIFDFDGFQAQLEKHPHYVAEIDWCTRVHFVHQRSSRPDAIPLLMLHGWPSCFYEFWDLIKPLTEPTEASDPAFHVVVASLPGFVWSAPPPSSKHYIGDVHGYSRILNALMVGLGYGIGGDGSSWSGYAVHGTDWGSFHARVLANIPGSAVKAVHTNFMAPPPEAIDLPKRPPTSEPKPARPSASQKKGMSAQEQWAYHRMQKYRPGALMHALLDSPAGLLSYTTNAAGPMLRDKPSHIAMRTIQPRAQLGLDKFLGIMTLYWVTGCIGTSLLPYTNNLDGVPLVTHPDLNVQQPLAYSKFPQEVVQPQIAWIKQNNNLVWAAQSNEGGHFPALQVTDALVSHIRAAFCPSGFLYTTPEDHLHVLVHREGLWDDERARASTKDATARL